MKQFYQKTLLFLLFAMVMQTASAYDCIVDGIYYNLNYKDNTATVTSNNYGKYKYKGDIVIPASITYKGQSYDVTEIGVAFSGCVNLNSITIPSSIKSISFKAFNGCSGLKKVIVPDIAAWCAINFVSNPLEYAQHIYSDADTEITALTIPNGVTSIGNSAFRGCIGLTSLTIPYSVTSIGDKAFYKCSSVKTLNLQDGLTTIGETAFGGCTSLTTLSIPSSVEHIKQEAFSGCENLENLSFPDYDSNHSINLYPRSFAGCGMKELHLSKNVEINYLDYGETSGYTPRSGTFERCKKLEYAYANCHSFSNKIFDGCDKLEKIVIGPNADTFMGYLKWCDMPNLKYIEVEAGNQSLYSQDNVLYRRYPTNSYFGHGGDILVGVANAKEGTVVIPDGVIAIREYAFNGCKHITSAIIPQSVYKIERYAFANCGIKSIEIPETVQEIEYSIFLDDTIDVYLYGNPELFNDENPFYGMKTNSRLFAFSGVLNPENKMSKHCEKVPEIIIFDKPSVVINPTSITIKDIKLNNIDDELTGYYFDETGNTSKGGLEPNANNGVTYFMKTGKHGIAEGYYSLKTPSLKLTTEKPKVTSKGEAVVCASTNMDEAETHAGFEWRKIDAPDLVESKQGEAVIYNGTMEGKIKNLDPSTYWKVRAYYRSNSGNMYYGDWVGFDPSDFSYFEPTVHTYGSPTVDGNSVTLTGMVVEGTDEILEQGFEYWKNSTNARELSRAPSDVQRVIADKGQRMTVTLAGLSPSTTYSYQAYVTTAKGTFYGQELSFDIPSDGSAPSAISILQLPPLASSNVYTLQGMIIRSGTTSVSGLPRGVYIVNGRKVFVK